MTWIIQESRSQKELAQEFYEGMKDRSILKIPGAHDAMSGLVAKQAGFECLYLSGAAYTASRGLPDVGLIHSEEVAERARDIIRATNLPLLVDIDNGFGGVLNTARTVKEMEEAGVAAIQIEDQDMPKKCGHLNGKKLISAEEMVSKIQTIKKIAPSIIIIARTDSKAVEGVDSALDRMKKYEEAGADAIFPEAFESDEEFEKVSRELGAPLLANMTEFGKTPYYSAEQFESFGYSMVIYPVSSLRVAAKAYEMLYGELMEKGTQKDILDRMQTRKELYETIGLDDYEALDEQIAKTELP
ncbi:methylisocitrate lyase [Pontibacillus marinus]|uniref:Methylisocitrate lyase n=1 Tax=Pontibacillus marinus BH030004 = DSM 16465 TaxID=1385511 RepID=A0A0A5GGU3_9BACI|nr:methylisocitrate lyase [Pontibacillus marinus]KGX91229.1 methylisocitrate lyase [Pontibacillus marinus BH030004 = DSM 16465]